MCRLHSKYIEPNINLNISKIATKFEFTNLKCSCPIKEFCTVDYCYLKSVNRTYKYASIRINVFATVTNVEVNGATFKRMNGYKPFLYNVTVDGCRFMENRNRNPVANYLFGFLGKYHNINHTCPYSHDIIIDKLSIGHVNDHMMEFLPFAIGSYLLQASFSIDGIRRLVLQFYGTVS
ncbi:uncharacterized protein [Drosophila pseudoobscura]|uniref:Uncharacterized protein n=1 Tax=Drosophila pseudoobscura pseudoobscura TaxID=46245 RepID=A0A6I8VWY6_DROPS|nr:uncharacterized protein LOC117183963 [Drosophila pseudoobscura]